MVDRIHGNSHYLHQTPPSNDFPNPTGNAGIDTFQNQIMQLDQSFGYLGDDIKKGNTADIPNQINNIKSSFAYLSSQLPSDHIGPLTADLEKQYGMDKVKKMVEYMYQGFVLWPGDPQSRNVCSLKDLVTQISQNASNPNAINDLLNNNYVAIEALEEEFQ